MIEGVIQLPTLRVWNSQFIYPVLIRRVATPILSIFIPSLPIRSISIEMWVSIVIYQALEMSSIRNTLPNRTSHLKPQITDALSFIQVY